MTLLPRRSAPTDRASSHRGDERMPVAFFALMAVAYVIGVAVDLSDRDAVDHA